MVEDWLGQHPKQAAWYTEVFQNLMAGRWNALSAVEVNQTLTKVLERTGVAHELGAGQGATANERQRGAVDPERASLRANRPTTPTTAPATAPATAWNDSPIARSRDGSLVQRFRNTIGASVMLCLVLGLGWLATREQRSVTPATMQTYTTKAGQRRTITLADGSTILMNVASRIQVPADYSTDNRTIHLTGEALFTVAPRAGTPFTVVSGHSITRVLGTQFVVRRYETDTAATIAVRDGKVAVAVRDGNVAVGAMILTAGQTTAVTASGSSAIDPAESRQFSFARGLLEFDNERLPDAIPLLNRWYNAEIRLGDSTLADQRVVGAFEAGSIADLASILEFTFKARVVRNGRVLTLYGER